MESCKLEIIIHSAKALINVKIFGTMDPYVAVWIAGDGKQSTPSKTPIATKGGSSPVWDCSMRFNVASMQNNYTLFCEIMHGGKLFDRNIGQVQIPFKDLLAGDASGDHVSYPVTIFSGEVMGEIILSHKFSHPEARSAEKVVTGKVAGSPEKKVEKVVIGKVAGSSEKKVQKKKQTGMMQRVGER